MGDQLRGATGGITVIRAMHDHGWLSGHTVHNLTIANTHTYYAGDQLVHNCAGTKFNIPSRPGVYNIKFKDGSRYIGISWNMRRRVNSHFNNSGKFANQCNSVKKVTYKRHSGFTMRAAERRQIAEYRGAEWNLTDRGVSYKNKSFKRGSMRHILRNKQR